MPSMQKINMIINNDFFQELLHWMHALKIDKSFQIMPSLIIHIIKNGNVLAQG